MDASADALVVGGGPAGLSAALYLGRYNRDVLVFDTGRGRSAHHQINHNYLGFPEGLPITALRELGRAQLDRYVNVKVLDHTIESISGDAEHGFTARAQGHSWRGRAVVLATGVLDHYPRFEGWEPCVGRSLFWCITCDGYENRGRNVLVVGHNDEAAGEAMQLRTLTDRIRLLTNSQVNEISEKFQRRLVAAKIPVVHDKIDCVRSEDGLISEVITVGGHKLDVEAMFSIQGASPQTGLARQLGVALAENGWIQVDTEQQTSVPGVYAAGDVTALHSHQVTTAVHEGAQAASAANYFLYPPDLKSD
jgi:thioredoxin reductase (NADPH)